MTIKARKEYLIAIRERYQKSTKKQKTLILNEFCEVCKYSRSYAIRILNGQVSAGRLKPGRKTTYAPIVEHLKQLWELMGGICSKNMKAAIPLWLNYYKPFPRLTHKEVKLLKQISPATIDRLLKPYKGGCTRGLSTTSGSMWIKNNIPLKNLDSKITEPGHIESDTVSHCGNSAAGEFISTLTMTDVFSNWTENRAVWTKQGERVLGAIKAIDSVLPFDMQAYSADNGNEVLNKGVRDYFLHERAGRRFKPTRGRPYKKNDNCYVEQKNHTHVRCLFGYDRLDDQIFVVMMNEIYRVYWNPIKNFFIPMAKLKEKKRVGSKIIKIYDEPKTPYQRLLESEYLSKGDRRRLKERFMGINPISFKRNLDKKLKIFRKAVEIHTKTASHLEKNVA